MPLKSTGLRLVLAGVGTGLVAVILASQAFAAGPTVRVDAGEVMVNAGDGFKTIPPGSVLESGWQVLSAPNSAASLVYPDGTVVPIQPGALLYVSELPGGVSAVPDQEWQTVVVAGPEDVPGPVTAPAGLSNTTLLMIAGVGAAAGGIVAIAGGSSSSPASP